MAIENTHEIIDQLPPTVALSILRSLADSDEGLAARIVEMALSHISGVDPEEIAAFLYDELNALEVEEVWDRAGPKRDGYVDPGEAADLMIDEVLEPFLKDLRRYQKLGLKAEANHLCMGLLWGFYQFEHESESEFKDWARDAPANFAWAVVDAWKEGSPDRADVAEVRAFVEDELGGWQARLLT